MVVLARKKSEAILIDGVIRIEVVNVSRATVRVRLRAPRCVPPPQAVPPRDGSPDEDPLARVHPVGMDDYHMTLVNQQLVNLGGSISLGVLDADRTRVLFFVDAPLGVSVAAIKPDGDERPGSAARQNLLQFMGQSSDRPDPDDERPARNPGLVADDTSAGDSGPELLPFPTRLPRRRSL